MKFKQRKSSKTMLSEKIADALTVKPRADIEDDHVFGTKPKTLSRVDFSSSESEDEVTISDFRKRSVNLLSEISKKYEGKVVSRKDDKSDESNDSEDNQTSKNGNLAFDSDSNVYPNKSITNISGNDTESDEPTLGNEKISKSTPKHKSESEDLDSDNAEESDDYSITKLQRSHTENTSDEDEDISGEEESDDDEGHSYDISQMEEPIKEQFEHVKKKNVSEEAKKGACVRNQLLIWEGLLEMRIHLQRCMNTANQMPMHDSFEEMKGNKDFMEETNTTTTNVAKVLEKLLNLQNLLLKKYPETKTLSTKNKASETKLEEKQDDNEEIPSDTDNEEIPSDTDIEDNSLGKVEEPFKKSTKSRVKKRKLEDYEKEIATSHKSFKTFRDTTIQKWNDKTRLATAANIKNAPTNTILQQISYILSDREKLVRRTQLKRSEYDIVGYKKPVDDDKVQNDEEQNLITRSRKDDDEYIAEIFDDSDFYHQLLRELIECKSADISDPVQLSRQWIALQQMRSKMKRKVDTKGTKGRKIKYVVHNQLVNYMAPEKCTTWNEDSTNELYSSLFGKMFERSNVGLEAHLGNGFKLKN